MDSDVALPSSSRWAFPCLLETSDEVQVTKPDVWPCMEVCLDMFGAS